MSKKPNRLSTGIEGLDEIVDGGLLPHRSYLVRGGPGTGKTTLGLHFLENGINQGERSLYISMTESREKIVKDAKKRGFALEGIDFIDLSPDSEFILQGKDYDIFPPDQVEQEPIIMSIIDKIKTIQPDRVFFDGVIQLKYLSSDNFQFRKQVLSFIQFVQDRGITVVLSSESSRNNPDDDLQFLSDGVINLTFSQQQNTLTISKFRGSDFRNGHHTYIMTKEGIRVFPHLQPTTFNKKFEIKSFPCGVPEIDQLLYGGLERNTSTVITGPSGVGKTTLGLQFMKAASSRGKPSAIYTFEENRHILTRRAESVNISLNKIKEQGNLLIEEINSLEVSPAQFASKIRREVKDRQLKTVMIDSISGYRLSFRGRQKKEEYMITRLQTLINYLKNKGITVLLINEVDNITGTFRATDYGISYLADNIIFLRYLEKKGKLLKAIGVLKKRLSGFENSLREFKITDKGIKVGEPLQGLRGVLSGTPEFID